MNTKHNSIKHLNMNHTPQRITPRRAKLPLLAAVLILFNIASAWGQTETINSTGEHYLGCGKTYNVNATAEGRYSFINNTGQNITISGIEVRTLRYGNNTYDYVIIKGTAYGRSNVGYGNGNSQRCYNGITDTYWGTVTVNNVTIASGQSATFEIVNNIYDYMKTNCTPAGFEFSITTAPCPCPTLTAPADGAILNSGSSVSFSWEAYAGATSYTLYVNGVVAASNITGTSHTYQATLPDGTHTWKVEANNGSTDCPTRTFTVCSGISCATNIQPADGTVLDNRNVSWDPVPCATAYEVFVAPITVPATSIMTATNDNGTLKYLVGEPTTNEYLIPLLPEGEYRWIVRPKNGSLKAKGCETHTFKVQYQSATNFNATPSTQGKEFFFSLMENGYDDYSGSVNKYTAIISPKEDATITFHRYARPNDDTVISVEAGKTATIPLKGSDVYHPNTSEQYKNRTVRVTSTADISLYIANEATNSFDASIVLPSTALGTDYRIQTFPSGNITGYTGNDTYTSYACFMVIATKENTLVKIEGANNGINPSATEVLLQEGESYFVRKNSYTNNDLSGIRVYVSPRDGHPEDECKTIAVFNGSTTTGVPTSMTNNYDHLVEQAYPISNWGTKFAITSTDGYVSFPTSNLDVDYIRITAAESTDLTFGGTVYPESVDNLITTDNLTAGQTKTYRLHRTEGLSCYIESTEPVACYLYQRSASQSGLSGDNMGDPSMVWIAPIERGIEEITFSTFAATDIESDDHWVNIVIPIEAINDGQAVSLTSGNTTTNIRNDFMTNGAYNYVAGSNNKYVYARRKISHGTYTLKSNGGGKMVVHVYGLGYVRGYAYAAGSEAVPYKSSVVVGTDGGNSIDISALQDPNYHFCSGVKYIFSINTNSTNVDSVHVKFPNNNGGYDIEKIFPPTTTKVDYTINEPGSYEIIADVYSTIYDNATCQSRVIKETVKDYTFIFFDNERSTRDTVCKGSDYTFTQKYYTPNKNGELEEQTDTNTFNNITTAQDLTIEGYSEYGCSLTINLHLDVYSDIVGGTIKSNTIECGSDGQNIGLSVVQLGSKVDADNPAAGIDPNSTTNVGDPNAYFQWQKASSQDGPWSNIENQTGEDYVVIETGYYRRAYVTKCTTAYSNVLYAVASGTFNPGDPIDGTVSICANEILPTTTVGTLPGNTTLDNGVVKVIIGGDDNPYIVNFQWEQSTDGGTTWSEISGATAYQYTIPTTYSQSTSFRRLITSVGPCTLNISSGEYHVVVKPTLEYDEDEVVVVKGCPNEDNAYVEFTITGGSGDYDVYYLENTIPKNATSLGNGKYRFSNLENSGSTSYTFIMEDNLYGCKRSKTITIGAPTALSIGSASVVAGCQGASINIDIPAITGGTAPYEITVESSVLGINEVASANPHPATIPGNVAAGSHTIVYKVEDLAGCYTTSTQNVLTIYENPVLSLSKTNITSCASPNGTITATVSNAPSSNHTYTIAPAITSGNSFSAEGTYTFSPVSHGNYTITVKDNHQCTATGSVTVEDNLDLTISTTVTDAEGNSIANEGLNVICPKKTFNVNVTQVNGANTPVMGGDPSQSLYSYSFDGGTSFGTEYTYSTTSLATCGNQYVNVVVKELSSQCTDEQRVQIIVEDTEAPNVKNVPASIEKDIYFCPSYTFDIEDYKQKVLETATDNCADNADLQLTVGQGLQSTNIDAYNNDGTIKTTNVTFTVTDLCGNSTSKVVTITPNPWPGFQINGTATADGDNNCYCHGDNITLTAVLADYDGTAIGNSYPEASYQWHKVTTDPETGTETETEINTDNDDNGRYSGYDTKELKINSAVDGDAGTYRLTITDPNGCTSSADITICVHPAIEFHLE